MADGKWQGKDKAGRKILWKLGYKSETHVFKVVFPDTTNHHNTMFGGRILLMMTETAFITATRFSRRNFVLVSSGKIDFAKPIPAGTLVELVGRADRVGNTSIQIAIGDDGRPVSVIY